MAARHDPASIPARLRAAAEAAGFEARLLCGAAGHEPPPGIRLFQPFADGTFLAEAEPGHDAAELSQNDSDLLRRLARWLADWPPDIVHLHDLSPFGMEFLGLLRRTCPRARLLLSLTPELAGRIGILGPPRGFLHQAPLRRFLAEATLLLPCESLMAPCLAFGLDPSRLVLEAGLPPEAAPCPLPPTGRFLVVAAFPGDAAGHALMAATAALMAGCPRAPILDIRSPEEAAAALPGAHLALLPGADPEGVARLARAMGRPVLTAAEVAMNPTALAHLLLDFTEAPERVAAMAAALPPPDRNAEAAAFFARYRAWAADPARIAPPARI
ncbi:hypothetical protein KTR66_22495 [Roseococcus sp. SDR]|uniref:glycosyltransferase n=1 Tax=Roseococcus sp. SDR TaxID=2835532 RepID=UPI001BCFB359|nr:glycosyltransferase [Roseococcus sp. SDR]MBS7792776.1 hypothetical protein [Roseococcus sp. SDR]MBV1848090.1 hypothetical protein [Roseococcus sp. SDR]